MFSLLGSVDGRAISSRESVEDFWRAAAAVAKERNCRGWVFFRERGLTCFKQRSLRCQYGRLQKELIQAANRMSRRIDPRRPKELTEAQSASIRQEEEIQELRGRRDELFQRIRHQFTLIYRAEGQAIYDQYEEAKRAVDRKIKEATDER